MDSYFSTSKMQIYSIEAVQWEARMAGVLNSLGI